MKLFVVVCAIVAATNAARLDNTYLPPNSAKTAGGSGSFLGAPLAAGGSGSFLGAPLAAGGSSSFLGAPLAAGGASASGAAGAYRGSYSGPAAAPIGIVRFNNDNNGDGAYRYDFETENRITAEESGELKNAGSEQEANSVHGSYTYTGPDGATYSVSYVADENGFQPQGAHLPTAPPVPEEILKGLQQNAADEAAGIVDDGQYRAGQYEGAGAGSAASAGYQAGGAAVNRQYLAPKPNSNQQGGYRY